MASLEELERYGRYRQYLDRLEMMCASRQMEINARRKAGENTDTHEGALALIVGLIDQTRQALREMDEKLRD